MKKANNFKQMNQSSGCKTASLLFALLSCFAFSFSQTNFSFPPREERVGREFPEKFALCGHNIKEFDVPYICRRLLIHQMPAPKMFDIAGKKPWETKHLLDTLELWKFGDNKNYTSIKLLTAVFDIPSPKDDIDGSQVGRVFYEEGDVERIARYCEKDVVAVMQLILKFKLMKMRLTIDGKVISD